MSVRVVSRIQQEDYLFLRVTASERTYEIHIRPVAGDDGWHAGHKVRIERVAPITGDVRRAERAALRALERISAVVPAESVKERDVSHATSG